MMLISNTISLGKIIEGGASANNPTLSFLDGVYTATWAEPSDLKNKPPYINNISIVADGDMEVGTTLTATLDGGMNGPFTAGSHQYQWYRLESDKAPTLITISGATSSQYTVQAADALRYLVCAARFVQVEGLNTLSPWFYSEMTDRVTYTDPSGAGVSWTDYYEMSSGISVPANWNTADSTQLINIGSGGNSTAQTTLKPVFSTDRLVFTKSTNDRVRLAVSVASPPLYEAWIVGRFRANNCRMYGSGNGGYFNVNSSNKYILPGYTSSGNFDTNLHIFRVVMNGASSLFQIDEGTINTFTETTPSFGSVNLGNSESGSGNGGDVDILSFRRTPNGVFLDNTQRDALWSYLRTLHGL